MFFLATIPPPLVTDGGLTRGGIVARKNILLAKIAKIFAKTPKIFGAFGAAFTTILLVLLLFCDLYVDLLLFFRTRNDVL